MFANSDVLSQSIHYFFDIHAVMYCTTICLIQVLMVRDKQWASVRAEAVRTLSHCLNLVKYLPGR